MPKQKIRKSVTRRFKLTKKGKVLHGSSFNRHLRRAKTKAHLRRLKGLKPLKKVYAKKIIKLLGK